MVEYPKCKGCGKELRFGGSEDHPGYCSICAGKMSQSREVETAAPKEEEEAHSGDVVDVETTAEPQAEEVEIDEFRLRRLLEEIEENQSLPLGIVGGVAAALIGSVVWAAITVATEYQIGWMAIGVGFLVGLAVRTFGKGMSAQFGIAGAIIALFGCLLGNLISVCGFVATEEGIPIFDVIGRLDVKIAFEIMKATFEPIDILFYVFALYAGYRYSFRTLTEEDLKRIIKERPVE
jgi:hypothetical protein